MGESRRRGVTCSVTIDAECKEQYRLRLAQLIGEFNATGRGRMIELSRDQVAYELDVLSKGWAETLKLCAEILGATLRQVPS